MAYKAPTNSRDYELLTRADHTTPPVQSGHHALFKFLRKEPLIIVSLTLGTCGTIACFAFTFWLAQQVSDCPDWALYCSVSSSVKWFTTRLALVQGILATLYNIFIWMVAYATHQLAETTLWPALTTKTFTMRDIDHYLSASRGEYTASPFALWHARGGYHIGTVLVVTLTALLLQVDSIIVGHVFSQVPVSTTFLSNHTAGGGTGFPFSQANPPGILPDAVGNAYPLYNAWANGVSPEPMPGYRDFIVNRSNLTKIGNFAINALEANKQINCSALPINITGDVLRGGYENQSFAVGTHMDTEEVGLRLQGQLTLWVDNFTSIDDNTAVTRIFFAAINGSIEGGYSNSVTEKMAYFNYTGISSLACDVRIALYDSVLRVDSVPGRSHKEAEANATLSSLATLKLATQTPPYVDAVWLAAVLGTFGVPAYGFQPMFSPGPSLVNETSLPVAFTTSIQLGESYSWTQATLENFIIVGSGALGMVLGNSWVLSNVTVASSSPSQEIRWLDPTRSYVLLVPLGLLLGSVIVQACISILMHQSTNLGVIRLGQTGELVASSQTSDMRAAFERTRAGGNSSAALGQLKVRYGVVADGYDGLAREGCLDSFTRQHDLP
ncbi:hypothetical protein LTR08_007698 [Meristemomyces frigidus]|nr:hypothetical protein LTR08_007698 [Meristemomyces frigidus]